MEHEKLAKVMEFCDQSWNFTNNYILLLNFTKLVPFLHWFRKSAFSDLSAKCRLLYKILAEIVMENQKMVMEKSWKSFWQSLGNPEHKLRLDYGGLGPFCSIHANMYFFSHLLIFQ